MAKFKIGEMIQDVVDPHVFWKVTDVDSVFFRYELELLQGRNAFAGITGSYPISAVDNDYISSGDAPKYKVGDEVEIVPPGFTYPPDELKIESIDYSKREYEISWAKCFGGVTVGNHKYPFWSVENGSQLKQQAPIAGATSTYSGPPHSWISFSTAIKGLNNTILESASKECQCGSGHNRKGQGHSQWCDLFVKEFD